MKPCDKCQKNVSQYIDEGRVTCFKTCKKWLEWKEWTKAEGNKRM